MLSIQRSEHEAVHTDSVEKDVPYGTLDLMVLTTLAGMGKLHGYGIARRIEQVAAGALELNQGTIYPALLRLEQKGWIKGEWGTSEQQPARALLLDHAPGPETVEHGHGPVGSDGRRRQPPAGSHVMTRARVFVSRLAGLFGRAGGTARSTKRFRAHLDLLTDDYASRGMSREDANIAARRALGRIEPVKEIYRDQRGLPIVDALRQDVRFAIRLLGRHRAFTLAAAGTLAVGIGVNTTFFTIVNAICIRGLPIERPAEVLAGHRAGRARTTDRNVLSGLCGRAPGHHAIRRAGCLCGRGHDDRRRRQGGRPRDRHLHLGRSLSAARPIRPSLGREFAPKTIVRAQHPSRC